MSSAQIIEQQQQRKKAYQQNLRGKWASMQTALIIATVYLNWSNKYYLINYADLSMHLAALLEFANRLQITLAIGFQRSLLSTP